MQLRSSPPPSLPPPLHFIATLQQQAEEAKAWRRCNLIFSNGAFHFTKGGINTPYQRSDWPICFPWCRGDSKGLRVWQEETQRLIIPNLHSSHISRKPGLFAGFQKNYDSSMSSKFRRLLVDLRNTSIYIEGYRSISETEAYSIEWLFNRWEKG